MESFQPAFQCFLFFFFPPGIGTIRCSNVLGSKKDYWWISFSTLFQKEKKRERHVRKLLEIGCFFCFSELTQTWFQSFMRITIILSIFKCWIYMPCIEESALWVLSSPLQSWEERPCMLVPYKKLKFKSLVEITQPALKEPHLILGPWLQSSFPKGWSIHFKSVLF